MSQPVASNQDKWLSHTDPVGEPASAIPADQHLLSPPGFAAQLTFQLSQRTHGSLPSHKGAANPLRRRGAKKYSPAPWWCRASLALPG
ncbi:hypothetical protein B0T44_10465 [Nocardia donostiensis]|uniref:Uncharacterized protein n=1 Tax=Nocardia donostiensis TaxID=1538463 RepID=A0A1V2TEZ5_9NOCA|nr:hypothetical protein B0T46_13810 [Nocardia donostiensis]OQS20316.1 hypothetical protein B0T44_10465 [Nocardia donostiensis]